MKLELIKFKTERYGLRRTTWFGLRKRYADFSTSTPRWWWKYGSEHFNDCHGSEEQARKFIAYYDDRGTVVPI